MLWDFKMGLIYCRSAAKMVVFPVYTAHDIVKFLVAACFRHTKCGNYVIPCAVQAKESKRYAIRNRL